MTKARCANQQHQVDKFVTVHSPDKGIYLAGECAFCIREDRDRLRHLNETLEQRIREYHDELTSARERAEGQAYELALALDDRKRYLNAMHEMLDSIMGGEKHNHPRRQG